MTPASERELARAEAIEWFDRLKDSNCEAGTIESFLAWLELDEQNAEAWGRLESLDALTNELGRQGFEEVSEPKTAGGHERRTDKAVQEVLVKAAAAAQLRNPERTADNNKTKTPMVRSRLFKAGALAMAASIGAVAYVAGPNLLINLRADHVTARATMQQLTLDDGSTVVLGAYSALSVRMSESKRDVSLLRGVAFFDVKPDSQRQFVVTTDGVATRVTGTRFEVRKFRKGAGVSVAEGKVLVSGTSAGARPDRVLNTEKDASAVALTQGETIFLSASSEQQAGEVRVEPVPPNNIARWQNGTLIVKNWKVRDLFNALSRHYPGTVVFGEWTLSDRLTSGTYQLGEPLLSLKLAAAAQGLKARQVLPGVVLVSKL